jgi:hypothetical protein
MGLESWPRKHFTPGGGDAFLFYQVFGTFGKELEVDEEKYRTAGPPEGIDLRHVNRVEYPDQFDWFKAAPFQTPLQEQPKLATALERSPSCLRVMGTVKDPSTLDYFRDAIGIITSVLDHGGEVVFDPQSFKWWSPEEWRGRVFDPVGAVPRHHAVTLYSEEETVRGTQWFHTRGMRKFGRPDLSIHAVPGDYRDAVIDLFDRFIEFQAFGAVIPEGQEIRVKGLPAGLTCNHQGSLEDNEFNNVHLDIRFDGGFGMKRGRAGGKS